MRDELCVPPGYLFDWNDANQPLRGVKGTVFIIGDTYHGAFIV